MLNWFRKRSGVSVDGQLLKELIGSTVFAIAAIASEGVDTTNLTKEQLLAAIRRELGEEKKRMQMGYHLFVYKTISGTRRLPVFTLQKQVEFFCAEFSRERNRVFPLMMLQLSGKFLAQIEPKMCDVVAINDKSADERLLTVDKIQALKNN